ncbi:GL20684 [Drosophila persimilis]|uniref:GL20684 n=1 Tax=Drosophila persimilis TaxID=7234 RepID=B4IRL2_DROPE|nr:GL20684 [Drosophila persimilis]
MCRRKLRTAVRQGMVWHHQTLHITWASGPAPGEAQPEAGARVWEETPRGSNSRDPRRRDPGPAPTTAAAEAVTAELSRTAAAKTRAAEAEMAAETAAEAETADPSGTAVAETADPSGTAAAETRTTETVTAAQTAATKTATAEAVARTGEVNGGRAPGSKAAGLVPRAPCRNEAAGPAAAQLGTASHCPLSVSWGGG